MKIKEQLLTSATLILAVSGALAQNRDFKWLDRHKDSALFREIQTAFSNELAPDPPQAGAISKRIKSVDRIALRGSSALVLISDKESEAIPYVAFRAFNFDLGTKLKSPIRDKDTAWFWMWRLEKIAHLTSPDDTDVVFQFLDCTECEAAHLLAAFHYSTRKGAWELRQWNNANGPWLKIGGDPEPGDDGVYWYDCLHVIANLTHDGLDAVAVRCRESIQPDLDKPAKRITKDETFLYHGNKDGQLTSTVIDRRSENFGSVRAALCATKPGSPLCRNSKPAAPRPGK